MWKLSLHYMTLLCLVFSVYCQHEKSSQEEKLSSPQMKENGVLSENSQLEQEALDSSRLLKPQLPMGLDEKRGKNFGFVGSRGRRGKTIQDTMFEDGFPARPSDRANPRLRMLLGKHHQGILSKEKRKPRFGFHGSRG